MDLGDKKILIADDILFTRRMAVDLLRQIGISPQNISEAENGVVALNLIKKFLETNTAIDLILSDWKMPQMDGFEFLQNVRQIEALVKVPFVLVTTEIDKSKIIKAAELNIATYIIKPYNSKIFISKITDVLKRT